MNCYWVKTATTSNRSVLECQVVKWFYLAADVISGIRQQNSKEATQGLDKVGGSKTSRLTSNGSAKVCAGCRTKKKKKKKF